MVNPLISWEIPGIFASFPPKSMGKRQVRSFQRRIEEIQRQSQQAKEEVPVPPVRARLLRGFPRRFKQRWLKGLGQAKYDDWLALWNMNFMTFHILGTMIPTHDLIFFRGVLKPPTRMNMMIFWLVVSNIFYFP